MTDTSVFNVPKRVSQEIQVLNFIRDSDGLSRVQLARMMGLHLPAVTLLTSRLIKEGLIREEGLSGSTGGRPGILLRLNPQAASFIGLEIGLNFVRAACLDLTGTVMAASAATAEKGLAPKELFRLIEKQVEAVAKRTPKGRIKGMGVAVAGMVDRGRGLVLNMNILQKREEVALASQLSGLFPAWPLVLHNDANAAALGEHWYGAARKNKDFFWVYLGLGVGMGIVSGGELYLGSHGIAGELGFSIYGEDGGYFTKFASGEALVEMAGQGRPAAFSKMPYPAKIEAVKTGLASDPAARKSVEAVGRRLGMGLAGMVNLFDPAAVYLGGPLLSLGQALVEPLRRGFSDKLLLPLQHNLEISSLGEEAPALGAAAAAIREFLGSARLPKKKPKPARS